MSQYRIRTLKHLNQPLSVHSPLFYAQSINKINMCYFMQPYYEFDAQSNPLIILIDRYGTSMINLQTSELFNL